MASTIGIVECGSVRWPFRPSGRLGCLPYMHGYAAAEKATVNTCFDLDAALRAVCMGLNFMCPDFGTCAALLRHPLLTYGETSCRWVAQERAL